MSNPTPALNDRLSPVLPGARRRQVTGQCPVLSNSGGDVHQGQTLVCFGLGRVSLQG